MLSTLKSYINQKLIAVKWAPIHAATCSGTLEDVQNLQETSITFRGIINSRHYIPRKNEHHPIISAIKQNHCACLGWYITNGFNIFGENLLQFVIDEIISKEVCMDISLNTIREILNLVENGWSNRNHPGEYYLIQLVLLEHAGILNRIYPPNISCYIRGGETIEQRDQRLIYDGLRNIFGARQM